MSYPTPLPDGLNPQHVKAKSISFFGRSQILLTIFLHNVINPGIGTRIMVSAFSSACLITGVCFAYAALKRPNSRAVLERLGGGFVVIGLIVLGAGLSIHL